MQGLSEREQTIIDILVQKGSVSVAELRDELLVSEVTIRSYLSNLEQMGFLNRVHGGAVPAIHPHIFQRQNVKVNEKTLIAEKASSLVQNGDAVMIEAGTTTSFIPRYWQSKRDIVLVTNSILAFSVARANPSVKITLTGGEFCNSTESFVGSIAIKTIKLFNVKYAFVGTDGFSLKSGITTHLVEGGDIITVMREQAEKVVLLADSSKYGKTGIVSILPLNKIDIIITDSGIDSLAVKEMEEQNIKVIIA